ncbi:hypothetical protein AAIA72_12735 [Hahella sp. SMD15-11]|uniref:DUF1579 domain-containing protein n=1 Tax=Thermohahella caldifontis TaxID=3142973 RepID=A0AB39UTQ4_9GAMM
MKTKIGVLLMFCVPVTALAADDCLTGKWEAVGESAKPSTARSDMDTLNISGRLTLEFGEDFAPGENDASKRRLKVTYEDYKVLGESTVGPVKNYKWARFEGTSEGHWLHPKDGPFVTLTPKDKVMSEWKLKMEIPGSGRPSDWQTLNSGPTRAPHRDEFEYECHGNELVLRNVMLPGIGALQYTGRFRRQ